MATGQRKEVGRLRQIIALGIHSVSSDTERRPGAERAENCRESHLSPFSIDLTARNPLPFWQPDRAALASVPRPAGSGKDGCVASADVDQEGLRGCRLLTRATELPSLQASLSSSEPADLLSAVY